LTRVCKIAFYSFCLTLWLMTASEISRKPSLNESRDQLPNARSKQKAEEAFFKKLPGINWTLFDVRFGDISDQSQIIGVPGQLNFPESAKVEVDRLEEEIKTGRFEKDQKIGDEIGTLGRRNRSTGSNVLVYNRVPKCASETMLSIIRKMSVRNRFRYRNSRIYWKQVLTPKEEIALEAELRRNPSASMLFDRHFYIFDLVKRDQAANFEWVNMVREPVSRLVSQFHYLRSARRWSKKARKPPPEWFSKSLDRCVEEKDPECLVGSGAQDLQLTYFCGSNIECGDPTSRRALQLAMFNLEKRFAVVGVMEEFDTSIALMEALLPRW